jgi:hypothetical protein
MITKYNRHQLSLERAVENRKPVGQSGACPTKSAPESFMKKMLRDKHASV